MKKTGLKKIMLLIGLILVAVAFVITVCAAYVSVMEDSEPKEYQNFNVGWYNENNERVSLDKITKSCVLHKKLPYYEVDKVLSFNARNVDVDVYIDEELIYRTERSNSPFLRSLFGKTAGSAFIEIPILKEYNGRMLYIDVHNPYSNPASCKIVHMYMGDGVHIVKHDASIQLGAFCFSIIILFLGVVCLVLYPVVKKYNMVDSSMLFLGVSALVFGMVMITDSKLLHLVVGHETLYYTMSQIFMLLLPIPLLGFFSKLYGNLNDKLMLLFGTASIVDFVVMLVLNFMGAADYHDNAPNVLLIVAGTIFYLGFATVRDIFRYGNRNSFHNIGVILIVVAIILDSAVANSDIFMETSFFTKFGIAGFVLMECVQVLWNHIKEYQKGVKAQLVSRLAYHDGLTDLLNRTSFTEDMEKLEKDGESNVLIGVFDVNNLKYVNDNYGHASGDELIIKASDCIKRNFGGFGKCYRIGGDEFILISTSLAAESNFAAANKQMMAELDEMNEKSRFPISVASGYSMRKDVSQKLMEVFSDADDHMYAAKKQQKASIELPVMTKIAG